MGDDRSNLDNDRNEEAGKETCGIIMPISATVNHSAAHWADVRTLITRAIEKAGFKAVPVWENSAIDRVSKRIIGNIFKFPIVIADISDSNPNVMLELGLRLSSKKPTIVIMNKGGNIPFDIHDFHALDYPPSLSILDMEEFISDLANVLKAKYNASLEDGYVPFLDNVVVDVVKPGERQVPLDKYVLDKLDELSEKISRQSRPVKSYYKSSSSSSLTSVIHGDFGTTFFFSTDKRLTSGDLEDIGAIIPNGKVYMISTSLFSRYWGIATHEEMNADEADHFSNILGSAIDAFGGTIGIPSEIASKAKIA